MSEGIKKRENIAELFTDEEKIQTYLHPRKRGRVELLKRCLSPVIKRKDILFSFLFYTVAMGSIPVVSAYVIYILVGTLEEMKEKELQTFLEALPFFSTIAILVFGILALFIISTFVKGKILPNFMYLRLELLGFVFKKKSEMDYSLEEDARVINSMGSFNESLSGTSGGLEGIWLQIFSESKSIFTFLIFSLILGKISLWVPPLGILALVLSSFGDYLYSVYASTLKKEETSMNRTAYSLYSEAQDFSYGKDIRVFDLKEAFQKLFQKLFHKKRKLLNRLLEKKLIYQLPNAFAFGILEVGIFYFVGKAYVNGSISTSLFIMSLSISALFVSQIISIGKLNSFVMIELVELDYLYDFLDAKLISEGGRDLDEKDFKHFDIEFQSVSFRYPNTDKWVLKDLNLTIKDGESLALVGVNGAGKSTLTALLNGLFTPTKGRILIGGIDSRELSMTTLKRIISMVFQEFEPLAVTVKENVASLRKESGEIDEERVKESLKKAGLYEKIMRFEKGIDTTMLRILEDDGMVLSGGENQKLSIARALYKKDSGIMILDEPTSALDALAEEKIYREFSELMDGRSAVFISHRLASTRFCDKIALLDGGKIKEYGTHEELIELGGLYFEMYDTQASYYKEEVSHD